MTRNRLLLATVLAIFVGSLAGCKSKPSLIGRWTGAIQVSAANIEMDLTFDKAGTLAFKQTAMGQWSTQKGAYKESEKTFTFSPTSVESPTLNKAQTDQINAQIAAANKTVTFDLVWQDANHIKITQQGAVPPLNVAIELKRAA